MANIFFFFFNSCCYFLRDYKSSGSSEKKLTEKPSYEGPRKEFIYSQDELKKITKRISRDFDANGKPFIRNIIHPESVTIPRRPGIDNHMRETHFLPKSYFMFFGIWK